jgi:hypothetical protein
MVSRIEPDRYANTGFAVKDTAPEINAMIFAAIMRKTPQERLLMGFDLMATARELAWSGLQGGGYGGRAEEDVLPSLSKHGMSHRVSLRRSLQLTLRFS